MRLNLAEQENGLFHELSQFSVMNPAFALGVKARTDDPQSLLQGGLENLKD